MTLKFSKRKTKFEKNGPKMMSEEKHRESRLSEEKRRKLHRHRGVARIHQLRFEAPQVHKLASRPRSSPSDLAAQDRSRCSSKEASSGVGAATTLQSALVNQRQCRFKVRRACSAATPRTKPLVLNIVHTWWPQ